MEFFLRKILVLLFAFTALSAVPFTDVEAQTVDLTISSGTDFINHYPGPDGLIGNNDDVISDQLTAIQGSEPNRKGSLGHNSFLFVSSGQQDPSLGTGYDAITFVEGSVTADIDVLKSGGGPIVTAMNITSGTEPFPGHGAYTSTITAVNSGTYDPVTGAFSLNVDISYTIFGNVGSEPGVELNGTAIFREAADFATPTGNSYVDSVAVPHAQSSGASSMLFITATGMLTSLGYPISTSLVALDGGGFNINAGLNDAWYNPVTAGQGFFLTVLPDAGLVFLSWFTFDTERPADDVIAILGDAGHRWLTAQGPYSGDTATLDVYSTEGGVFDQAMPAPVSGDPIGTITIV